MRVDYISKLPKLYKQASLLDNVGPIIRVDELNFTQCGCGSDVLCTYCTGTERYTLLPRYTQSTEGWKCQCLYFYIEFHT